MSLKELAKEVLQVQDASNILGVALSFSKAMVELKNHLRSSDEVAIHPITTLWIHKLESMNCNEDFIFDYDKVKEMAKD